MKVSVVIPSRSDPVLWATLNSLGQHLRNTDHEIIVVENSPEGSTIADGLRKHCKGIRTVQFFRYIGPPSSCLYKEAGIRHATGDVVICCDSHVLFETGAIPAAVEYLQQHPLDLVMGPCFSNAFGAMQGTNQMLYADEPYKLPSGAELVNGIVCRGGKLGAWVKDDRGLDPAGEPFEIQQQGTGAFAFRREAWPGFHPAMTGFGGNETFLMESFRHRGGRVVCHPAFRWVHDFANQERHDWAREAWWEVRNYLVGFKRLELEGCPNGKRLWDAAAKYFAKANPKAYSVGAKEARRQQGFTFDLVPFTGVEKSAAKAAAKQESSKPAKPATNKPAKPSVYDAYIEKWKAAGGDVGGAVPAPLFVWLCHLKRTVVNSETGEDRPLRSLEFGCGLSTLAFDRQKVQHTAIEHSEPWMQRTAAEIVNNQTTLKLAPLKNGWYDWRPQFGDLYDVILIDGPPATSHPEARLPALDLIPLILAPFGNIAIDDTHREAEQRLSAALASKLDLTVKRMTHGGRSFDLLFTPTDRQLGTGPGTDLRDFLKSLQMPSCQSCWTLARRMNIWGPDGCIQRLDQIVDDMLPRAREWWKHSKPWMKATGFFHGQQSTWSALKALVTADAGDRVDSLLRDSIRTHVIAAAEGRLRPLEQGLQQVIDKLAG